MVRWLSYLCGYGSGLGVLIGSGLRNTPCAGTAAFSRDRDEAVLQEVADTSRHRRQVGEND